MNYLIAGIKIDFKYKYDQYFKDNIEHYLYDGKDVDHRLHVHYEENLKEPSDKQYRVFSRNIHSIKAMMIHNESFTEVDIYIDPKQFTDLATAEYIYSGMMFLEMAQRKGLLPLHGSAISYKGDVILFSAPSGTGKSTHARMWKRLYPNEVEWVNDDKPLVEVTDEGIFVYGAPFSGQYSTNTNQRLPLKSIVFLEQGITDKVTRLSDKEALKQLMTNTLRPQEEKVWDLMISKFEAILKNIPIYHLEASLSTNAALQVKKTIYGE